MSKAKDIKNKDKSKSSQSKKKKSISKKVSLSDGLREDLKNENEKFLRLFAEFENYKKRTSRERIELFKTANKEVMSALIPVMDDYDRANNKSARKFLLESIQDNVRKQLEGKVKDEDTFADIFLIFIEMTRPYSTDLHNSIKKK